MTDDPQPADASSADLLARLQAGDAVAAEVVFQRYMQRLTALARARLSDRLAARTDPEDVVMSAWRSFFVGADRARFSLKKSGDLWRLLVSITMHKLYRQVRHHTADRRGVQAEQPLSGLSPAELPVTQEPTPEEALALVDEVAGVMGQLDDRGRRILQLRLQEWSGAEIAAELGCSERTVRRQLARIGVTLERHRETTWNEIPVDRPLPPAPLPVAARSMVSPSFSLPDFPASLSPDEFHLRRMIGAGRMGKVYQAWWHREQRMVAVKYLRKGLWKDRRLVERFRREAQLVASFDHPGIVKVLGLGSGPAGGYFIAMEWVEGTDLGQRLGAGPRPTEREVVDWIRQASAAIAYSCDRGVIHCDLKPENLLLGSDGKIRVTDYGLAHLISDQGPLDIGRLAGTAPYMAPEQVSSRWGEIGPATDVYGLGGILLAMLTGQPPYPQGDLAEILAQVVSRSPVSLESHSGWSVLSPALQSICRQCLQKEQNQRFREPAQLRTVLQSSAEI